MKAQNTKDLAKWEHPQNSGIWIREFIYSKDYRGEQRNYAAYQVTVPGDVMGKKYNRKRKQLSTKEEAEQYAENQAKGKGLLGKDFFEFSGKECREYAACMERLRDKGLTLTDAVDFAIKHMKPPSGERTLSDVIQELQDSKSKRHENGDLGFHSLKDFKYRSGRLKKDLGDQPIHEIDEEEIKEWATSIAGTNRTRMNHLRIASEIFRHAEQKRYLKENPFKYLSDNDRKEIHGRDSGSVIKSLTLEQAERLIFCAASDFPEMLGVITLGCFCAIRTEELQKLTWDKVDFTRDIVTIGEEIAKKRKIRHVTLPENAKQWLTCIPQRKGNVAPVTGKKFDRLFSELRAKAGFVDDNGHSTYPRNGMRHGMASHHYERYGDSILTSKELGHKYANDDLLFSTYRSLVRKGDGLKYFSITPASAANKIVEFAG